LWDSFDYPYDEIKEELEDKGITFDADSHFYQLVRRHISKCSVNPSINLRNFRDTDSFLAKVS